jgi:hypothetical protein
MTEALRSSVWDYVREKKKDGGNVRRVHMGE